MIFFPLYICSESYISYPFWLFSQILLNRMIIAYCRDISSTYLEKFCYKAKMNVLVYSPYISKKKEKKTKTNSQKKKERELHNQYVSCGWFIPFPFSPPVCVWVHGEQRMPCSFTCFSANKIWDPAQHFLKKPQMQGSNFPHE